jgi:threonyl-tRNA synthetase
VRIITVNQESATEHFAQDMIVRAKRLGIRASVDSSNESVGKKIRAAEIMKVPYTVVVGEKEVATKEVLPRIRKDLAVDAPHASKTVDEFLKTVAHEATSRVHQSSL